MLDELKALYKEVETGPYYPATKTIEKFIDIVDSLGDGADLDIVDEQYIIDNKTFESVADISNFVSDVENVAADYYIVDGYENLKDITKDNLLIRIEDELSWYAKEWKKAFI